MFLNCVNEKDLRADLLMNRSLKSFVIFPEKFWTILYAFLSLSNWFLTNFKKVISLQIIYKIMVPGDKEIKNSKHFFFDLLIFGVYNCLKLTKATLEQIACYVHSKY